MTEELFRQDAYLKSCDAVVTDVRDGFVKLDKTVFYPTGGGQPGDSGVLKFTGGDARVVDTRKDKDAGGIWHVLEDGAPVPAVGDSVTAEIDWDRRHKHMRMHTCMHLLCSLVDGDVTGGQVGEAKSRLDFNIPESPDKDALSEQLNAVIQADHPVTIGAITDAELDAQPDLVRTMSVAPPRGAGTVRLIEVGTDGAVDRQPCGGTHVASTGEIGAVRIAKIENKGKQNRRINIVFADV